MPADSVDNSDDPFLNEFQAAEFLGLSYSCLRVYRYKKKGPRFSRLGPWKGIRYRLSDLRAWLKSRENKTAAKPK